MAVMDEVLVIFRTTCNERTSLVACRRTIRGSSVEYRRLCKANLHLAAYKCVDMWRKVTPRAKIQSKYYNIRDH